MLLGTSATVGASPPKGTRAGPAAAGLPVEPAALNSGGTPAPAELPAAESRPGGFPEGWLVWAPPPECPGRDYIEGRIREWLGGGLPASAELRVVAQLALRKGETWEVRVRATLNGRTGDRHVQVERCSDAADFVALAVVLAVNPEFGGTGALTAAEDAGQAPPRELPSPFEDGSSGEAQAEPGTTPEPAAPRRERAHLAGLFGVKGEVSVGPLPGVRAGIALEGGVSWPHLQVVVTASAYPTASVTVPEATGPIDFSLLTARASGCYRWGEQRFKWGPCLSAEVGVMQAGQKSGHIDPPSSEQLWAAFSVGALAEMAAKPWLSPFALADLSVPMTRPRFVLEDGQLVHQPAALGVAFAVGVRFLFPAP